MADGWVGVAKNVVPREGRIETLSIAGEIKMKGQDARHSRNVARGTRLAAVGQIATSGATVLDRPLESNGVRRGQEIKEEDRSA
ncbi:hypothetical protein [Bradyrhizobium sp. URHD0069]|uniref:hypothetical protein n=1 Tax=Bradyrhizobium sp. URHD0069 TaxID=1380355 RepID=UPI0018CC5557|nr:hypothetical protein [Bradyrhizobium sp. URHD0069]